MIDQEAVGKVADATAELAKTTNKALALGGKFGSYFSGPLRTVSMMMDVELQFIAARRGLRLSDKWSALLAARNAVAPTRHLPPNFVVPLLGSAVLEEDDELQDAWARLLVNAGDASTPMELRTAYVEILKGMSAFDVQNLQALAILTLSSAHAGDNPQVETVSLAGGEHRVDSFGLPLAVPEDLGISLGNLTRLGCIVPAGNSGGIGFYHWVTVTYLGIALYRACS